jgi:hypothetical protein
MPRSSSAWAGTWHNCKSLGLNTALSVCEIITDAPKSVRVESAALCCPAEPKLDKNLMCLLFFPQRLLTGNAARPQNGFRKYRQTQLVYRALWKSVKRKMGQITQTTANSIIGADWATSEFR